MPFTPDPKDVEEHWSARKNRRAFSLGGLPTRHKMETIEAAIRKTHGCAGYVVVYWPALPLTAEFQHHRGWCHIVCPSRPIKATLQKSLDGLKAFAGSNPAKVGKANEIGAFARITHIRKQSAPVQTQTAQNQEHTAADIEAAAILESLARVETPSDNKSSPAAETSTTGGAQDDEKMTSKEEMDWSFEDDANDLIT
ncbi:hypothetical protein HD806DRAFT_535830 [Xylariaceae sp. AK1471]|nr:hypothetical protein HD806DRAFT_535830 [Xylariaceae sp. AK1471]